MKYVGILTDFGDLAVLLPVAVAVLVWLWFHSRRHLAPWWLLALALCGGATAVLKILFIACPPLADLHSPSGHTSLSVLVYGALGVIVAGQAARGQRPFLIAGGVAVALAIAASRVVLHDHTVMETVIGLVVGAVTLALFGWRYAAHPLAASPLWPLLVPVAVLLVGLHGHQLRAEEILRALGLYLHDNALACR